MDTDLTYGFKKTLNASLDEADARLRAELKKEGFGILTEIDVKSTLEQKLGVDFRPYRILGACNPSLAHRAFIEEIDIGLLLPCNAVVYEGERAGTSVVAILDPAKQLAVSGRTDMGPLAEEVREKLMRVAEAL